MYLSLRRLQVQMWRLYNYIFLHYSCREADRFFHSKAIKYQASFIMLVETVVNKVRSTVKNSSCSFPI